MTTESTVNAEVMPIAAFTEKAYLDYSMYVILDRALPNIGDGLKPVQRRIVYAMSELGLNAVAKHKKSARTVGDVLGKYHPHGDVACYEAMVLMAQAFSYRYPLIDGQGNWGSADDPKSFAAMRYTEAKLAPFAMLLLRELEQGTVVWQPNFDGSLSEPTVLPARVPQVLLNGTTGIAVGMATDIPPHNLVEVVQACLALLDNGDLSVSDLCQWVAAPDFPTSAEIITPDEDLKKLYRTGQGSVRMRATYVLEAGKIVVTALPYQVSGARIVEQIAQQMRDKKLVMVEDVRDESDHEHACRIVIFPRSNRVDVASLMLHLFASTDLERSYRVNMNIIGLDGRPRVHNLKQILSEWLRFRIDTVKKRLQWRLDKVETRLHVLAGLLIAYLNLDDVIRIIRSEDKPRPVLMSTFALSAVQADAILEIKLRQLAKLEELKLREELEALEKERRSLEQILGSERRLKTLVKKELKEDADTYGDARRSLVVGRESARLLDENTLISSEPVTVVISQKGWVRMAKGHDIDPVTLAYKVGDEYLAAARGSSHQSAVFLDSSGRTYALPARNFPSARGLGEPLSGKLKLASGVEIVSVMMGQPGDSFLLATSAGYGYVIKFSDMLTRNRAGKAMLRVLDGAQVLPPVPVRSMEEEMIVAVTRQGYCALVRLSSLPLLSKGKGVKIVNIPSAQFRAAEESLLYIQLISTGEHIVLHCGKRHKVLKPTEQRQYQIERGRRGGKLPRGYRNIDRVEVIALHNNSDG